MSMEIVRSSFYLSTLGRFLRSTSMAQHAVIALLTLLQLATVVATARAEKFDEKVRAPEAPSNAELKARILDYFETYARVNSQSAAGIVRDKAAHAKWFDTQWSLQRAIDAKRPLGDLAEFGLTPGIDGSYSINLEDFPQWDPLDVRFTMLLEPSLFAAFAADLKHRGFRDQDIYTMKAYLERNQLSHAERAEKLAIAEGFVARASVQLQAKRKIEKSQFMAYIYQNSRNQAEVTRTWAVGLLDSLDKQRQRIMESFFLERSGQKAIGPDNVDAQMKIFTDRIASGEYVRMLERERVEAQR